MCVALLKNREVAAVFHVIKNYFCLFLLSPFWSVAFPPRSRSGENNKTRVLWSVRCWGKIAPLMMRLFGGHVIFLQNATAIDKIAISIKPLRQKMDDGPRDIGARRFKLGRRGQHQLRGEVNKQHGTTTDGRQKTLWWLGRVV